MSRHRSPVEMRPARLAALAKLPVFLDLAGKRAVIAGSGPAAAWKAELVAAAGGRVDVFAEDPCPELLGLAGAEPRIRLVRRSWTAADLADAALAVGDFAEADEAASFARTARALRVPVNVVDRPACCDFQFGAIVNRTPVVVGISTDGAAPVLAQAIRRRIEATLPASLGAWAAAAHEFRARLASVLPSKTARRRFWEAFVDRVFGAENRVPVGASERPRAARNEDRLAAVEALAQDVARDGAPPAGEVVLVGAGPGDPELVTLAAVRALQSADVVVYDRLVTPEVLELARREARRVEVGKHGHGAACRQEDINALLLPLAREGLRVVRLKGGDPSVFGRAGEEIAACRAAGIAVRVVPGVTTALAAGAALTASLTHRDHARRVQFVTAHDRNGRLPEDLDLAALSDPRATTCIYMGRRTTPELAAKLMAGGLSPETPAALLASVSRADERIARTTLGALADAASTFGDAPVIVLIGDALRGAAGPESTAAAQVAAAAADGRADRFRCGTDP